MKADTKEFTRKLKLRDRFHDHQFQDDSLLKKKSNFTPLTRNQDLTKIIDCIEQSDPIFKNIQDNLSSQERKALQELKNNPEIVIKKADKGNTLVVMSTEFYRDKLVLNDHINTPTYQKTDNQADKKTFQDLKKLMRKHEKCITKNELKYVTEYEWQSSNMYVQPKIHKNKSIIDEMNKVNAPYLEMDPPQDLKGRPIIAGPNSPTQHLSQLLDKIISPIVPYMKSYVKDDWDFRRKLPVNFEFPCKLHSCDIVSLFSNITHELGLTALEYYLDKYKDIIPGRFSKAFIMESASFILVNNNFFFDNILYHQVTGTAMGTTFAPPYACIAIGFLEETKLYPTLINTYNPEVSVFLINSYLRYMDDGFIPWPENAADVTIFEEILNTLDDNIVFTMEAATQHTTIQNIPIQKLNFLDITVILDQEGNVKTDIYYKDTNTHDYLLYNSHHPQHIKDNIPYTLAKRIIVFCSDHDTETHRLSDLKSWLLICGYPTNIINKAFHNAKLQGPAPEPRPKNTIPFITTYASNYDSSNISKLSEKLLRESRDENIRTIFKDTRTVLALKQPKNILRQLTSAKFESIPQNTNKFGLFKCNNKRCLICKLYIQECTSFQTSNNKRWDIRCHITCNSINVIYFLMCLCCNNETSYTGKTNNFRFRMNQHISEIRTGNTTDRFDKHVIMCKENSTIITEPYFKVYAFIKLPNEQLLLPYESHLHNLGFDTMN